MQALLTSTMEMPQNIKPFKLEISNKTLSFFMHKYGQKQAYLLKTAYFHYHSLKKMQRTLSVQSRILVPSAMYSILSCHQF